MIPSPAPGRALAADALESTWQALGLPAALAAVEPLARAWLQAPEAVPVPTPADRHRLALATIIYELCGVAAWPDRPTPAGDQAALVAGRAHFQAAWVGYLAFVSCDPAAWAEIFAGEDLPPATALALHLALTGLLTGELPLTRQALDRVPVPCIDRTAPWRDQILQTAGGGLIQLIRQAPGDLAAVAAAATDLLARQETATAAYLEGLADSAAAPAAAGEVRGLLHLIRLLQHTQAALYSGAPSSAWPADTLHDPAVRRSLARHLFLLPLVELFGIGCRALLLAPLPAGGP